MRVFEEVVNPRIRVIHQEGHSPSEQPTIPVSIAWAHVDCGRRFRVSPDPVCTWLTLLTRNVIRRRLRQDQPETRGQFVTTALGCAWWVNWGRIVRLSPERLNPRFPFSRLRSNILLNRMLRDIRTSSRRKIPKNMSQNRSSRYFLISGAVG